MKIIVALAELTIQLKYQQQLPFMKRLLGARHSEASYFSLHCFLIPDNPRVGIISTILIFQTRKLKAWEVGCHAE